MRFIEVHSHFILEEWAKRRFRFELGRGSIGTSPKMNQCQPEGLDGRKTRPSENSTEAHLKQTGGKP